MTGHDIKSAMFRAFGISDKTPVGEIETFDVDQIGAQVRRILLLFSFGMRGTQ